MPWNSPFDRSLPDNAFMPAFKRRIHLPWRWALFFTFFAAMAVAMTMFVVQNLYASRINTRINQFIPIRFAIVLGASVLPDGTPSDALSDRVLAAVDLYKGGAVAKLLMTGDDGKFHADEVTAMANLAIKNGVAKEDIIIDGKGYRTYESCKRAVDVFNIKEAVVVTQRFHLPRALFLCNKLGMEASGFTADRQTYQKADFFYYRELLASVKAFSDIYIHAPKPPVAYTE